VRRLATDHRILLGAIVALGLAVRLAGIGDTLSADEGYSWLVGSSGSWAQFLERLAAYENTPPLFYLLLTPLPLDDEVWLRLPSLLASLAAIPVLYAIVRDLLDSPRAGLIAALGLAVAPYAVSFSNYSRAFTLASLGLLLALWAAVRLARGGRRRWWLLYAAGAIVALYSEYDAAIFLAVVGALLILGVPPRREALAFGALPALALVPWIGQLDRGLDQLDKTKVAPTYPSPSPASLRDVVAPLFLGEHGAAEAAGPRTVQVLLIAAALAGAAFLIRRQVPRERGRLALWLLGGTALATLGLYAIAAWVGPDVFQQRYLTILIPLGIGLLAGGVAAERSPLAVPVAVVALVALGVAVLVQREGRELEQSPQSIRNVVPEGRYGSVLTNSAVVSYYLRDRRAVLDRPFGLGPGLEDKGGCKDGCAVVDDNRVAGGPRPGQGVKLGAGPYSIRLR
jgi:4-amino-4-deoxy-L-arabinose transferase-like glycosyltransferase